MNFCYKFIFFGLLLLFSTAIIAYPSYQNNNQYEQDYPILRMTEPGISDMYDDIGQENYQFID
ncbi:unnamed protein product, partial [Rotaria sp. Silwood2]